MKNGMGEPAERMKMMRARRRQQGLRELRLVVPDARSEAVRNRIAAQVAKLNPRQRARGSPLDRSRIRIRCR